MFTPHIYLDADSLFNIVIVIFVNMGVDFMLRVILRLRYLKILKKYKKNYLKLGEYSTCMCKL